MKRKVKNWAEKLKEKIQSSPIFILLSLAVVVISAMITIGLWLKDSIVFVKNMTIDHRLEQINDEYETIISLRVDTTVDFFISKLGSPIFINNSEINLNTNKEYIFVKDDYYCEMISDENDKVIFFSVTSRKIDFKPKLDVPSFGVYTIGETKFSDINNGLVTYFGESGMHYFKYEEIYYYGNPGNYQYYYTSNNDSGAPSMPASINTDVFWEEKNPPDLEGESMSKIRDQQINTFGVISSKTMNDVESEYMIQQGNKYTDWINIPYDLIIKKFGFSFGVNHNQVRILDRN